MLLHYNTHALHKIIHLERGFFDTSNVNNPIIPINLIISNMQNEYSLEHTLMTQTKHIILCVT